MSYQNTPNPMKNKNHNLRPVVLILAAASVFTLSACGPTVGLRADGYENTGDVFRFNGLTVEKVNKANGFRTAGSAQDKTAANELIKYYEKQSWAALKKGDGEAFAVARYLGAKLTRERLEQVVATRAFVVSLADKRDGSGMLPAGGRVFMPNNIYEQSLKPAKHSASRSDRRVDVDRFIDLMEAYAATPVEFERSVAVASAGDVSGILGAVSAGLRMVADSNRAENAKIPGIQEIKVGDAYAAKDQEGNRYFIERTAEGIILDEHQTTDGLQY